MPSRSWKELKAANPDIEFGFIGLEGFEQRISILNQAQKTQFLGPAATNQDSQDLQVTELKQLINGVIAATEDSDATLNDLSPVPADKLDENPAAYLLEVTDFRWLEERTYRCIVFR